jgi:hypothetical protein
MDTQSQDSNLSFYASLFSGSLLVISELLPYISKIKGNGILQVIGNFLNNYEEKHKQEKIEKEKKIKEIIDKLDILLERSSQPHTGQSHTGQSLSESH